MGECVAGEIHPATQRETTSHCNQECQDDCQDLDDEDTVTDNDGGANHCCSSRF